MKELGYSEDKRKRRRQHRRAAKKLLSSGGFFDNLAAPGTNLWMVAQWHKEQARRLCYHV